MDAFLIGGLCHISPKQSQRVSKRVYGETSILPIDVCDVDRFNRSGTCFLLAKSNRKQRGKWRFRIISSRSCSDIGKILVPAVSGPDGHR